MNRADGEKRAASVRIINNEIAESIVLILEMKEVRSSGGFDSTDRKN